MEERKTVEAKKPLVAAVGSIRGLAREKGTCGDGLLRVHWLKGHDLFGEVAAVRDSHRAECLGMDV